MNIPFEIMHKKINISKPLINWQHEQFSRKRILSGTLSSLSESTPGLNGASIFDNTIDMNILIRNIKFISEVLCKFIYHTNVNDIIDGSLSINEPFIHNWITYLGNISRVTPYMEKKDSFLIQLEKTFSQSTADMKKSSFLFDGGFKFYKDVTLEMNIYRVKPMMFDVYLLLIIVAYLTILYVCGRAPTNMNEWKHLVGLGK
jgi:hypothetical protein